LFQHGVVAWFGFRRRYVADGLQEPSVIEPINPFEGNKLNGLEVLPWSTPVDHLGPVETVDGFGESIVVGISDTADRRLHARFIVINTNANRISWKKGKAFRYPVAIAAAPGALLTFR